jgi:hypothetical protein
MGLRTMTDLLLLMTADLVLMDLRPMHLPPPPPPPAMVPLALHDDGCTYCGDRNPYEAMNGETMEEEIVSMSVVMVMVMVTVPLPKRLPWTAIAVVSPFLHLLPEGSCR